MLVVDDDEVIRQLIAVNLTLEGFDVATAVDGQDCLDKVQAIAPDVITLDVMMPRLDGWETAVQLRKAPETAHIKVVLITARAQEDDIAARHERRRGRLPHQAVRPRRDDPRRPRAGGRAARLSSPVITRDLRDAIARRGSPRPGSPPADPGLRPTGTPGQYASSVALAGEPASRAAAGRRAGGRALDRAAEVTGPGYLTVTVTPAALAALAERIAAAGPACAASDALRGVTVPAPPTGDPLAAARLGRGTGRHSPRS